MEDVSLGDPTTGCEAMDCGVGDSTTDTQFNSESASSSSKKRKQKSVETSGIASTDKNLQCGPLKESGTVGDFAKTVSHLGGKFKGVSIEDVIILEICAGSARLTKAARSMGLKGVAIDHTNERSCGVDICIFDLTDASQLQDLLEYIRKDSSRIALIWVAPPCGTASRARERPIPGQKHCPKPLRSLVRPDALDGLSGVEKLKVELANQLYDAVLEIVKCAAELGINVAIENPTNSHYWNTTPTSEIIRLFGDNRVVFHACAHGGTRDKSTSIWQLLPWFDSLALLCDKKHAHDSWRPVVKDGKLTFPTAQEAAYPVLFCERIVACVISAVKSFGAINIDHFGLQNELQQSTQQRRITMGALPRGSKIKPLVAEFQSYEIVHCDPQAQPKQLDSFLRKLPKGARVTHRRIINGEEFRGSECFKNLDDEKKSFLANCGSIEACTIGIPAEPLDFLARAIKAGHPRGMEVHVDKLINNVIVENFHDCPYNLASKRVKFLRRWQERAKQIDAAGDSFIGRGPEHAQKILVGKRLQLWHEILCDLDYNDKELIDDISSGFKLTGWMRCSGNFAKGVKRPAFSRETLLKLANGLNRATLKSMERRQDADLEAGTWQETMAELEKGWIWMDESKSIAGKVIAKRFGLQQGSKLRVIDDCTCGGLNHSVGLQEKFQLHSIDLLASMMSHSFSMLTGASHPRVVGRTYDLRSAYKQFPISAGDRDILRIAVNQPGESIPAMFGVNALPFGAVGSVSGFLRISHSLWYIGTAGLGLCWTAFYDDFSVLTRSELLHSTTMSCELLFKLLGVDYADSGKKAVPFSENFKMLGLVVNTEKAAAGVMTISHTPERKQELTSTMKTVLDSGSLTPKDAERLRGRMVFFEGYTFGRIANSAVKRLGRASLNQSSSNVLVSELKSSLTFLMQRVASAEPISIERRMLSTWLVFTDGACVADDKFGGIGGLLISPTGKCACFFSSAVPIWMMEKLSQKSANPIHELELLPLVLALSLWQRFLDGSQVVWYIDNESARMAAIKGSGETEHASLIIDAFVRIECNSQIKSWFSRVPSHSNPADGVSRLLCDLPQSLGAERTTVAWEKFQGLVISEGSGAGGLE